MPTLDPKRMDPNRIEVMDDAMVEVFRSMTGAQRLEVVAFSEYPVTKWILNTSRSGPRKCIS